MHNEAYLRITVARAARENPALLDMVRDGRLHLSGIARLAPYLRREDSGAVLKRACGMAHREIQEFVRERAPRPDVATSVRRLPRRSVSGLVAPVQLGAHRVESDTLTFETQETKPDECPPSELPVEQPYPLSQPPKIEPLSPARYMVRFTAGVELRGKIERLQALMRSSVPDGDLARKQAHSWSAPGEPARSSVRLAHRSRSEPARHTGFRRGSAEVLDEHQLRSVEAGFGNQDRRAVG